MNLPGTYISLFSGCGGLDVGFAQRGFQGRAAYDLDPAAVKVHSANLGAHCFVKDLASAMPLDLLPGGGPPDVLLSGSPCQGFSLAGKRRLDDPRNSLLLRSAEIATAVRPKVFVAENVTGATYGEHGLYWSQLEERMRAAGYATATLRLDARAHGLAQSRMRVVLLAWTGGALLRVPQAPAGVATVGSSLAGVARAPQHKPQQLAQDSPLAKIAARIGPGQKLSNVRGGARSVHTWHIPEVFGPTTQCEQNVLQAIQRLRRSERRRDRGDADPVLITSLERELGPQANYHVQALVGKGYVRQVGEGFDLTHTFNGKFRRLDWSGQSITVDTRIGDPRYFLHPTEHRGLTVREAARLQGFPDDFAFEVPERSAYRMIGNAVPPPMAAHVAEVVRSLL